MEFNKKASKNEIIKTINSLKANGINAYLATTKNDLIERVFELINKDSEVMTMTSVTLNTLGITKEINESGNYNSTKKRLSEDVTLNQNQKNKLGAAPEIAIGSVHAVTNDGKVIIASNTGSQLPAYVYGAEKVIWIVGTQKIVTDLDMALKRIYEYVLPLESERAKKAYGSKGSFVSKLLIINKEINPQRVYLFFIDEVLGF